MLCNKVICPAHRKRSIAARCLQEAASNHIVTLRGRSQQYFAADPELAKLDLIFVILRMQIRMQEYPSWVRLFLCLPHP